MEPSNTDKGRFIVSCFLILIFLFMLASNQVPPHTSILSNKLSPTTATNTSSDNNLRILIGILTLPDHHLRRHLLRLVYGTQPPPPGAIVDVKFVLCNLTKEEQKVLVALEIMRYDDIIILDCEENMNNGKTLTYFSSLPELLNDTASPPYHYVVKADDDTYLRLNSLVESLKPLPREDLYYGYVIPCGSMDPFVRYMSGMGYLVSWDIVEWIRDTDIPRKGFEGPEDKVFGEWMREGRKGMNRHNAKWSMYNFPEPHTKCSHELWPDTIAVHLLKNQEKWVRTLKYFNVTRHLKWSKFYHIA
ncbi:hydroxyproline O-galactosyltransferase GALT3-like [Cajanus cajan]|uniref:hydroxyproline O-galactosyltransferase GALT3-like n=1 Tax=Cajanus cajan TaxID=3821 RepID=UPI00098DA1BE|nr:hydroxyproline O-galactosyltransferase GALT3-like [Cajanus cajan]